MKRTVALLRTALRSNFGLSLLRHRLLVEKKDLWAVPLIVIGLAGFIPLVWTYLSFLRYMYASLQPAGQESTVLTMAILAGQLLVLIFGLYYVLSAFYFSQDLEFLISLPVKPSEVMLSKFGVILANEYLITALVVLPAFVSFGILDRRSWDYWILAALVYLFLPVIPLAISGLLVVGMMRLINISRKKDFFILTGMIVLIGAVLFLQFGLSRTRSLDEVFDLFMAQDGLVQAVGAKFPPSIWATQLLGNGFRGRGLGGLALFGGGSAALFLFLLWVSEKIFYRGLIGLTERSPGRKRLSRADVSARVTSGRRPVRAIFLREWKLMNRTPVFLLNGVLTVFLIPVILILALKSGGDSGPLAAFSLLGSVDATSRILIAAVFFIVCGSLNGTAPSTFSRDGRQFWISKVIPVDPARQVLGKFAHSFLVSLLGAVAGAVVVFIMFRLGWGILFQAVSLALLGGVFLTALNMAVDLARPLLKWTNPQKAIKQNMNVLVAMLLDVGILFGFIYLVKAVRSVGLDGPSLIGLLLGAAVLFDVAALGFLLRFAAKRYPRIEA